MPLLFALAFIWPFSGRNATEVQMRANTSQTPAAQGTVTVSTGNNNNTQLDVKVKDLAPPANLQHPAEVYVVWIQPENQSPKNEGQIMVKPDRSGQLKTETPFKHFKLFITAEKSPTVTSPSGPQVLNTLIG
ncbi:MAG TPA: hypothetical protein VGR36_06830 [Candidatus Acidoferrales bacterium]|nr:hypothetical protein [Candidatus Acidoferrales bacterium]